MTSINLVLQGKGGVGKTLVASLLAQYKTETSRLPQCIDTDPVNASFSEYGAFKASSLSILGEDGKIDERRFDGLMETLITSGGDFVIDNGASTFVPLTAYLAENAAFDMLINQGKKVHVHTVITGGQALQDTLTGLDKLASSLPSSASIVVWLNEYFGPIKASGKTFEEMNVYKSNARKISGIIRIPRKTQATFGKDIEMMLERKITFDEVMKAPEFSLMAKSRLNQVRGIVYEQMKALEEI